MLPGKWQVAIRPTACQAMTVAGCPSPQLRIMLYQPFKPATSQPHSATRHPTATCPLPNLPGTLRCVQPRSGQSPSQPASAREARSEGKRSCAGGHLATYQPLSNSATAQCEVTHLARCKARGRLTCRHRRTASAPRQHLPLTTHKRLHRPRAAPGQGQEMGSPLTCGRCRSFSPSWRRACCTRTRSPSAQSRVHSSCCTVAAASEAARC